jgi:hypothetical protein
MNLSSVVNHPNICKKFRPMEDYIPFITPEALMYAKEDRKLKTFSVIEDSLLPFQMKMKW